MAGGSRIVWGAALTPCGRQQVCAEYYKLFCCLISHRLPSRRTSHFISSIQSFTGTVLPVTPGYFHRFTGTRRFPEEHAKHPSILSSDPRRGGLINCLLFFFSHVHTLVRFISDGVSIVSESGVYHRSAWQPIPSSVSL